MTKKDLYCLTGENWLNDKVVGILLYFLFYLFPTGPGVLLANGCLQKMSRVPVQRRSSSKSAHHVHLLLLEPHHARVQELDPETINNFDKHWL